MHHAGERSRSFPAVIVYRYAPSGLHGRDIALHTSKVEVWPTSGHGYAPCGRWRYSLRKASRFFQLKTIKKLPRQSALIFTSAAPHPTRMAHCSALGLVAGFRPPRPRLSGVPIRGVIEVWVSRIEPSGQGISPEPCTTHGFGVGGSAGSRTQMSAVMSRALLPIEIRNHTAACRSRRKYPDCMLRHTRASTALPEPIPIAGCGYPLAGQAGIEPAISCIAMRMGATPRCPI